MPELLALAWLMPVLMSERECSKAKRKNNADKSGTQSGSDDDGVSSARAKDEDEKHHFLSHKIAKRFFWHALQVACAPKMVHAPKTVTPKGDQSTSKRAYTDVRDAHNSGLTYVTRSDTK
jgi:hypothetical protein